ncbi:MAG: sugar ABC transporter permease [Clostridia bacterium]|nr:sugar ABC transporter permease [Clostridia bacterium]
MKSSVARRSMTKRERKELREGLIFASPWIIGFLCFLLVPLVYSIYISLTNYNFLNTPKFIGIANYQKMLFKDPMIWHSLRITLIYALVSVPLQMIFAFILALLLNMPLKGVTIFRTIFYVPSLVVVVASSLLWRQMLNTDFGIINYILSLVGIPKVHWLANTGSIITSLVIIHLWGCGRAIIINLSGMQGIPTQLYEAAEIDGASKFRQVFAITIPMLTPTIFLNLLTGMIGAFKSFAMVNVLTQGGPNNASKFYMLYLFENAFKNYRMGYASAMSWLLFLIVAILTLMIFKSSNSWVHYSGGVDS